MARALTGFSDPGSAVFQMSEAWTATFLYCFGSGYTGSPGDSNNHHLSPISVLTPNSQPHICSMYGLFTMRHAEPLFECWGIITYHYHGNSGYLTSSEFPNLLTQTFRACQNLCKTLEKWMFSQYLLPATITTSVLNAPALSCGHTCGNRRNPPAAYAHSWRRP